MAKRITFLMLIVFLAVNVCALNALATAETATSSMEDLYGLIHQRLSYMKDVAAYKYVNKVPIEDKEREKVVLKSSVEEAAKQSLSADSVEDFFALQIELAKKIQRGWQAKWQAEGFPENTTFADLKTEVRPQLLDLGQKITATIAQVASTGAFSDQSLYEQHKELILQTIQVEYIDEADKLSILDALTKITVSQP